MESFIEDTEFKLIFREHHKAIYNYVLRMVKERSIAEELTQDIFVKVYKSLPQFRGDSGLPTWIYKIATNACLDHFRSRVHKKSETTDLLILENSRDTSLSQPCKEPTTAEEQLISMEMSACIRGYIDDLPEDYRAVILLHDLQGFTNPEIAEITGTTLDTVKIRLHRARRKMRDLFSCKCSFYRDERNVLRCVQREKDDIGDKV